MPELAHTWGDSPGTAQATHAVAREGDATLGSPRSSRGAGPCAHPSFPGLPGPAALALVQLLARSAVTQGRFPWRAVPLFVTLLLCSAVSMFNNILVLIHSSSPSLLINDFYCCFFF